MGKRHVQEAQYKTVWKSGDNACSKSRVEARGHAWSTTGGFREGMIPEPAPKVKYMTDKGNEDDSKQIRVDTSQT